MPVYVYRNLNTGETFEVEQRITESAWTEHPESGDPVKRLVQPVGIAFRGSGFYVTDSRPSKSGASAKGSKEDGGGGSSDAKAAKGDGSAGAGKSDSSAKDTKVSKSVSTSGGDG